MFRHARALLPSLSHCSACLCCVPLPIAAGYIYVIGPDPVVIFVSSMASYRISRRLLAQPLLALRKCETCDSALGLSAGGSKSHRAALQPPQRSRDATWRGCTDVP